MSRLQVLKRVQMCNTETQDSNFSFTCGTSYEEVLNSATNDSPCVPIQFYSTVAITFPSKRLNLINMTSNKVDVIPDELKSCELETIEQRYATNEKLHIYTDGSYLPEANGAGAGWFCRLFEDSLSTTNYGGEVLTVCEATAHLLAAGLAPAKAILALSINTSTKGLNTIHC
ncbi:uncharacterized protein TNCV_2016721 [Trichonephila clavipes]|nr:uncharacterized protein TNCV_2016721 [Trichonephila clavipes]